MSIEILEEMDMRIGFRLKEIKEIVDEYSGYNKERVHKAQEYRSEFSRVHRQYRAIAQGIVATFAGLSRFDGMEHRTKHIPASFKTLEKGGYGTITSDGDGVFIRANDDQKEKLDILITCIVNNRPKDADSYLDFIAGIFRDEITEVMDEDIEEWQSKCAKLQNDALLSFYKEMESSTNE